tara:strand:+ start:180 stop:1442 length:1263 start_codon:yes stop_codon:yes gene_type:complete
MKKHSDKIKFCKRCLYSNNHPLGLVINEQGICSGCLIHEEKDMLDWKERWEKLKRLIKPYISKSGKNYDCVIPVTGSHDSYFIVYTAKKLGLKPLLVNYNKYFNTPLGIKNLTNLRIKFDCDILYQNVNPVSVKKITRHTFMEHGNIYWPTLAGGSVFPVQIAAKYEIPLIIWGAHQGLEQVGMYSHEHEVEMSRRYREDHDLFGLEENQLISLSNNINEEDIFQYLYPDDQIINSVGIRGIYLGNYLRWDPVEQHKKMIEKFDYKSANFKRTFDSYDYVDCFNYMNLHDYLKLCKHGYSKVTDHASREIRFKRITRDQGIALVKSYELIEPEYTDLFCEWLGISSKKSLSYVINRTRNKKYWEELEVDNWKFKGLSSFFDNKKIDLNESEKKIKSIFLSNSKLEDDKKIEYITFGKGYN